MINSRKNQELYKKETKKNTRLSSEQHLHRCNYGNSKHGFTKTDKIVLRGVVLHCNSDTDHQSWHRLHKLRT